MRQTVPLKEAHTMFRYGYLPTGMASHKVLCEAIRLSCDTDEQAQRVVQEIDRLAATLGVLLSLSLSASDLDYEVTSATAGTASGRGRAIRMQYPGRDHTNATLILGVHHLGWIEHIDRAYVQSSIKLQLA